MDSLARFAHDRMDCLAADGVVRQLHAMQPLPEMRIRVDGEEFVNFSSNDYFGLAQHPAVIAAMRAEHMAGAGASRLVTGTHTAVSALEEDLAEYAGTQAALVFGSGYLANIGTITALADKADLILADRLCHACMFDGAKLSGATLRRFRHNDLAHLEDLLKAQRAHCRNCIILTETIFSMDGDAAPLPEILELAKRFDCWVISDNAHGIGFMTPQPTAGHIQMGTLSKGLGGYGGYICATKPVVDLLISSARAFMFTTGLPACVIEAAKTSLTLLQSDAALRQRPRQLAKHVTESLGLPEVPGAIVPIVVGDNDTAIEAALQLEEHGIWVHAIRPPTVPKGTARLRICLSAAHSDAQVAHLIDALKKVL